MYLFYDKQGVLKEIINDEALRQGNYGINKLYIYVEDRVYTSVQASYLLPSELIVGPMSYDDFTNPDAQENTDAYKECLIPFNQKRDLKYFKYFTPYKFIVVDLTEDLNGNGPLDEAGLVHCDLIAILDGGSQLQLGELNFDVELNSVLNQNQVASQEYLALSDYKYLLSLVAGVASTYVAQTNIANRVYATDNSGNQITISVDSFYEGNIVRRDSDNSITVPLTPTQNGHAASKGYVDSNYVPYTGATGDINLGEHYLFARGVDLYGDNNTVINISTGGYISWTHDNNEMTLDFPDDEYGEKVIATRSYVDNIVSTVKRNAYQVVSSLPAVGEEGIIYLVEIHTDVFEQYIWEMNMYVSLGTTEPDLSNYVAKTTQIAGVQINTGISAQELTNNLIYMNNTTDLDDVMED